MADTQIDELRLDITVEDNTSGESSDKKVKNLATAISRLNKVLSAFDNAKFSKTFENMAKGIEPFVKKIDSVSSALESLATIVKKSGLEKAVEQAISGLSAPEKESVSTGGGETKPIRASGGQAQQLGQTSNELKKVNKQIDDIDKKSKKSTSSFNKLMKSIGRIAFYRTIRRAIQEITQAFTESIDGIAQYNSEFRDTMGSLQSSIDKAKASVGVAFYQTLIVLEPVITAISNGIVHLSNGLSYLSAKLRGSSTYMRINTEYMKEYQSAVQGTLLSFDTFETLSGSQGIDYSKMLEEVETSGSSFGEELGNIKNILIEISGILLAIGGYKIVKWIADGGIKKLTEGLGGIKGKIDDISNAGLIAGASFVFLTSIANLIDVIKNWDSQSLVTKITAITSAALGFAAVVFSILAAIPGIGGAKVLKAIAVGATALAAVSGLISAAKFADGGMFEGAGTMYALAGENGAEIVAQGSQGTGVANVEQIADAVYRGNMKSYYDYGIAQNGGIRAYIGDIDALGTAVARSTGFKNETKRQGQRQYFN